MGDLELRSDVTALAILALSAAGVDSDAVLVGCRKLAEIQFNTHPIAENRIVQRGERIERIESVQKNFQLIEDIQAHRGIRL